MSQHQNSTMEAPSSRQPEDYPVTIWETVGIILGAIFLVAIGVAGLGVKAIQNAREFCGGLSPVIIQRGMLTLPDQSTLPVVRYGVEAKRATDHYIAVITAVGQNASENAIDLFRSIRCTTVPDSSPLTQQSSTINPQPLQSIAHLLLSLG
jgi:hypothetical protein